MSSGKCLFGHREIINFIITFYNNKKGTIARFLIYSVRSSSFGIHQIQRALTILGYLSST